MISRFPVRHIIGHTACFHPHADIPPNHRAQLRDVPRGEQAPLVHEPVHRAYLLRVPELMCAEEHRGALGWLLTDQGIYVLSALRVKAGGWLVKEQNLRTVEQRPRQ